jgi:hypothetical protein
VLHLDHIAVSVVVVATGVVAANLARLTRRFVLIGVIHRHAAEIAAPPI